MLARLGAFIGKLSDVPLLTCLAALACGFLFAGLEFGIMGRLPSSKLSPEYQSLIDAGIIGTGAALSVWLLLLGNRDRRRRVREDLARIAELNHEIRNALQVIAHSQYTVDPQHRDMVLASVSRIDAVLKRVFPIVGASTDPPAGETARQVRTRPTDPRT